MASNNIFINVDNIKLKDLVNITSKTIGKTIILPNKFNGKINIIQNNNINKNEILNILKIVLKQNNYKLVLHNNIYEIIKIPKNKKIKNQIKKEIPTITTVVHLKNAKASNIKKVLSPIINKNKKLAKQQKIFISSDDESNSIVLMGSVEYIKNITNVIHSLDDYRAQIYVSAKIIEVSEQKTKDIGIKYGLEGGLVNDNGIFTLATSLGGDSIAIDTSSVGLSIPNLNRSVSFGASINLLNQEGALNIVSSPSLLCINNKKSSIYIGQTKSFKINSEVTTTGAITDQSFTREDIGLRLVVTPRISNDTKVLLDISTVIEDVGNSTTNGQPDTSKKEIITTAIVNTGESVIIGGLTKNTKSIIDDSVAGLGDLPWIGGLFSSEITLEDKINLIVIVTPYIIPKSKDLSYIREQLSKLQELEDKYTKDILEKFKN
jgi:general secretion pathway protein D